MRGGGGVSDPGRPPRTRTYLDHLLLDIAETEDARRPAGSPMSSRSADRHVWVDTLQYSCGYASYRVARDGDCRAFYTLVESARNCTDDPCRSVGESLQASQPLSWRECRCRCE